MMYDAFAHRGNEQANSSSAKVALKRDGNRRKAPFPFLFSFFSQCSLFSYGGWLDVLRYITMIDFTITLIYQNVTIHNVDLEIKQSEKMLLISMQRNLPHANVLINLAVVNENRN